jgi:hypothetical protein
MDFSAGWREGLLFWSTHLIVISIIVSVLAKSSYRYVSEIFLKLFIALLASSVFFNNFDNIYADPVLALSFGFLLFVAIQASCLDGRWAIVLALTAGFVTLTKPIGIYFAVSAILVNIVATIFKVKFNSGKKASLAFVPALVSLTTIGSVWYGWGRYWLSFSQSDGNPLTTVPNEFKAGNDIQQIASDFMSAFFNGNLRPGYSLTMTSLSWTIVCGLFLIFWAMLNGRENRRRNIAIAIAIAIITVGYFLLILFSYLSLFGPGEAANLASYPRYIGTWYQGVFFTIVLLLLSEFSLAGFFRSPQINQESNSNLSVSRKVSIFIVALLGITTLSSAHNYLLMLSASKSQGSEVRDRFTQVKEALRSANLPESSSAYIIAQHSNGFEYYVIRYELTGLKFGYVPWSIGSPYGEGDIWTDPAWDIEKWSKELREFDYVVLYSTTQSFDAEFGSIFESGVVEPNSVYRITKTKDSVSLSKVS